MYILGINAYHGDASAAIVCDGELVAAAEEERFNRHKHCAGFPADAITYCLAAAGISLAEVEHIGISRNPAAHLPRKILYAVAQSAKSLGTSNKIGSASEQGGRSIFGAINERIANAAKVRDLKAEMASRLGVERKSLKAKFHYVEHHRAHLASSFFVSPFERAALLSLDGFGDFISTMCGVGQGNSVKVLSQVEYPHSAGIIYTATTQFIGFPHYGDEGKVMGLAPYGVPRYADEFRDMIRTEKGGRFRLNLDYFRHHTGGVEMNWEEGSPVIGRIFSDEYVKRFGAARLPGEPLTKRECDIAASLQQRLEEVGFHILNHLHEQTGLTNLGLSGGVALNSVMNGKILLHTPFKRVFVQPAAGDSGTAIGVCFHIYNGILDRPRSFVMEGAYTGPEFSDEEIRVELERGGHAYESYTERETSRRAAQDIADGAIVGWFQGRMEFGPRALGNRSIIADPRRARIKEVLNERIKRREPFRPFAPSILAERVGDYFEQIHPAPTMLMVYQIKEEKRAVIPAVTHVDGSGRLQTVSREINPRYHRLISDFCDLTGVPVVLNTSFNENEPIVCTPSHAINCFLKTRMDVLYLGNHALRRIGQGWAGARRLSPARTGQAVTGVVK